MTLSNKAALQVGAAIQDALDRAEEATMSVNEIFIDTLMANFDKLDVPGAIRVREALRRKRASL